MRKREPLKSPVREIRTPGSVRGPLGNRRSYRDERDNRRPFSRLAALSLLCGIAFWSVVWQAKPSFTDDTWVAVTLALLLVAPTVLGGVAAAQIRQSQGHIRGRSLARAGVWMPISNIVCLLVTVNLVRFDRPGLGPCGRASRDTKTAVTQALASVKDRGVYPASLRALRDAGYANVLEQDPWGNAYVLAPSLVQGAAPQATDDVYAYSRGPAGTGTYMPELPDRERGGSVGYSSRSSAFRGCDDCLSSSGRHCCPPGQGCALWLW